MWPCRPRLPMPACPWSLPPYRARPVCPRMTAAPATPVLAALNKCLAKSNKSRPASKATKRRNSSASVWKPRTHFRGVGQAALMSQPTNQMEHAMMKSLVVAATCLLASVAQVQAGSKVLPECDNPNVEETLLRVSRNSGYTSINTVICHLSCAAPRHRQPGDAL
jgi:hypothetical protein